MPIALFTGNYCILTSLYFFDILLINGNIEELNLKKPNQCQTEFKKNPLNIPVLYLK